MENLDDKTLQSFNRVLLTSHESNNASSDGSNVHTAIKQIREEAKNTRIVLRSKGEPFPCPSNLHQIHRPPFVVCLAHHQPTDIFTLFAFTPKMMPCRLVRFDRDGKIVNRDDWKTKRYLWSNVDASAFVAAVDICEEGGRHFFSRESTSELLVGNGGMELENDAADTNDDNEMSGGLCDRASFLRLVKDECRNGENETSKNGGESNDGERKEDEEDGNPKEDSFSIKSLIQNELLHPKNSDVGFFHPDPNFLIPLSTAISKELQEWRSYCKHVPPAPDFDKLLQKLMKDYSEMKKEGASESGFESGSIEEQEYNEITQRRDKQVKACVGLCKDALKKTKSLLNIEKSCADEFGKEMVAFGKEMAAFGKATVGFLAALELRQQELRHEWREFHEAFDISDIDMETESKFRSFKPWMESNESENLVEFAGDQAGKKVKTDEIEKSGEGNENKSVPGEDEKSEEPDNYGDAAAAVVECWLEDDMRLYQALSNAFTKVESAVQTRKDFQKITHDFIQSFEDEIETVVANRRKMASLRVAQLVKIWNTVDDDDDFDAPWLECCSKLTEMNVTSLLSFGHCMYERQERAPMYFVLDHLGIETGMGSCFKKVSSKSSQEYDERLETTWDKIVLPSINDLLSMANKLLGISDLFNSALLIMSGSRILCDKSNLAHVRSCCSDPDGSYEVNDRVTELFRNSIKKLNIVAIKIAFRYANAIFEESPRVLTGARWFYNALNSGAVYFPTSSNETGISWHRVKRVHYYSETEKPSWYKYSHMAASIFAHGGWQHPLLSRALEGDILAIQKFSNMESQDVIKERFMTMKGQNKPKEALNLARMQKGDQDAMHFLFINGKMDEAIVQASLSRNVEGLARLAADLVASNPYASLLCMQANFICAVELDESHRAPDASVQALIDVFFPNWTTGDPNVDSDICVEDLCGPNPSEGVPSLRFLSKLALCRSFLRRAKVTADMQHLVEKNGFENFGLFAASASISITMITPINANDEESLKDFLEMSGLFSVPYDAQYKGVLTVFDQVPGNAGRNNVIDVCGMIYEAGKFLIGSGCNELFCFEASLFAAVKIAVLTGCDFFASERLHWLGGSIAQQMKCDYGQSPLNCLTACFSDLFFYNHRNPMLMRLSENLLSAFFELKFPNKNDSFINKDVQKTRVWAAIAYLQYQPATHVATCLSRQLFLNKKKERYYNDDSKPDEEQLVSILNQIKNADSDATSSNSRTECHTMEPFESSKSRARFKEEDRREMCAVFIQQVLSFYKGLGPSSIANIVRTHRQSHPTFWQVDRDQVEQRLVDPPMITSILSKKCSLNNTYLVVFFVLQSLQRGESWSSRYFILVCGLGWLRTALQSEKELIKFDQGEKLSGWNFDRFMKDRSILLESSDWDPERSYSSGKHQLEGLPKFTAFALITVLKENALEVERAAPILSSVCREVSVLCCVMEFLIEPNMHRFKELQKGPSSFGHLNHRDLANFVISSDWSCNPDFSFSKDSDPNQHKKSQHFWCLVFRVELALKYGKMKEAQILCVAAGEDASFWKSVTDRSCHDYGNHELSQCAHDLVQSCLMILNNASRSEQELSDNFLRVSSHVLLTMNWFRCCPRCSSSPEKLTQHGLRLIPSPENYAILHETSLAWNDIVQRGGTKDKPTSSFCLGALCCVSRCCTWINDSASGKKGCYQCCRELGNDNQTKKCASSREERAKLRKKRKWMSSCNMESDFDDLESYVSQMHLKEASVWCREARQRIMTCRKVSTKK